MTTIAQRSGRSSSYCCFFDAGASPAAAVHAGTPPAKFVMSSENTAQAAAIPADPAILLALPGGPAAAAAAAEHAGTPVLPEADSTSSGLLQLLLARNKGSSSSANKDALTPDFDKRAESSPSSVSPSRSAAAGGGASSSNARRARSSHQLQEYWQFCNGYSSNIFGRRSVERSFHSLFRMLLLGLLLEDSLFRMLLLGLLLVQFFSRMLLPQPLQLLDDAAVAATNACPEGVQELAVSRSHPVTYDALESLITKAIGELTQKISASTSTIVKANSSCLIATEVQRLFSSQLQTAVQEACEAAKLAALSPPQGTPSLAAAAAHHQNVVQQMQQLECNVSNQLQTKLKQHITGTNQLLEEHQRLLQQHIQQQILPLQHHLHKWQQAQQQQMNQMQQLLLQMTQQIQQVQQQLLRLQQVQHQQTPADAFSGEKLLETVDSHLKAQSELLHKVRLKSVAAFPTMIAQLCHITTHACAAPSRRASVWHGMRALLLCVYFGVPLCLCASRDEASGMASRLCPYLLGAMSSTVAEFAQLRSHASREGLAGVSEEFSSLIGAPSSEAAEQRRMSAHFTESLKAAVEENKLDEAFGLAISADIRQNTKGFWVTHVCKNLDADAVFDVEPPALSQPVLLGVGKVLTESLASEASRGDLEDLKTMALWISEALTQMVAPSQHIESQDLSHLLHEFKTHLLYAQANFRSRDDGSTVVLGERIAVSLRQLKRLIRAVEAAVPTARS
ncbi:hypothetical protein cyc_01280 [Cyclospora cayetanensis]|uniref:Uncharacterized protein n=1 Tax=Cyclospora cayetanensis TaxID=88456 RepID=A0A1D3CX18_9EIME|nr:hypothetical protein cyc_01280 [Cyclospora cayetanensis]